MLIDFLKDAFGVELDHPDDNSLKSTRPVLDECMNCTKTFKGHRYPFGPSTTPKCSSVQAFIAVDIMFSSRYIASGEARTYFRSEMRGNTEVENVFDFLEI